MSKILPKQNDNSHLQKFFRQKDFLLQGKHYGAGGIDKLDVVFLSRAVCGGRLAVGAYKHLGIMQLRKTLVGYHLQALGRQPFHLLVVVDNIAQAIQLFGTVQVVFRRLTSSAFQALISPSRLAIRASTPSFVGE